MRPGGIGLLAAGILLATAGSAVAANNVAITISEASSQAGQGCVNVAVKDSVTGQPAAADFVLVLTGTGPFGGTGETPVSSNSSGNGSVCFNPPTPTKAGASEPFAAVTLLTGNAVTVQANPDYQTVGTSNTAAKSHAGTAANITALVRNAGPRAATGSTLSFTLSSGLRLVRLSGKGATCHASTATCAIASMGSTTLTRVVLVVIAKNSRSERVTGKIVAGSVSDPAPKNNSASLKLTVIAAAKSRARG